MTLLQAVLMGIIQGLTEFLPVSSSGHLALFKILFHVETDTGMLFDVLLHVGTLIAICAVYYKDIVRLFVEGICIVRDVLINFAALIKNLFLSIRDRGKDHVDYSPYRRIVNSSYRKFGADPGINHSDRNHWFCWKRRGRAGIRTSDRAGHLSDRNRNSALYRRPLQGRRQASEGHYIHQCVCRWYCSGRGNFAGTIPQRNNDHSMSAQRI